MTMLLNSFVFGGAWTAAKVNACQLQIESVA